MQTAGDIPLQITSENSGSERRITPSWSIGQLKSKLELVTGIPPLSQKLSLRRPGQPPVPIEAIDEENTSLAQFPLVPYAEIYVSPKLYRSSSETRFDTLVCLYGCVEVDQPTCYVRGLFGSRWCCIK